MTETENSMNDFSRRKSAFEKYRRAQEAVKKAAAEGEGAMALLFLQHEQEVFELDHLSRKQEKGEDPEMVAALITKRMKQNERERHKLEEKVRNARTEENQALAELAEASK